MNNFAVFFCLEKPVGNDNARLPVIVREALAKVRPVGHVVVRARGTSFALRWLAFTVDAVLSLRAWQRVYTDAVDAGLFACADIGDACSTFFVLTDWARVYRAALSVFFLKTSRANTGRTLRG